MKILELHYSTAAAGAERFLVDISNELSLNHEVVLCTTDDDSVLENSFYKNEISHKIKYINLKCKSGLELRAIWRILKVVKEEKPDVVHSHADLITLFLPGFYVAITNYHTELLPTELLFTIAASRNTVPFPVIFEIFLMEFSFELIREAGLRVPTPIGPTIRNCWCINIAERLQ